jgi:bacteriocin-like protein
MEFNQLKTSFMKQTAIDVSRFEGMSELSIEQLQCIEGGGPSPETSFWYDLPYLAGATLKAAWTFAKSAVEYQHSLPANLKK